jgi:hypothetical protein
MFWASAAARKKEIATVAVSGKGGFFGCAECDLFFSACTIEIGWFLSW